MEQQKTKQQNAKLNEQPHEVKTNDAGKAFFWIFVILTIGLLAFWYVFEGNKIKKMEQKVSESEGDIDVQLTQRKDMLTKLIESTKQSMKWEKELQLGVTKLRSANFEEMTTDEKAKLMDQMDQMQREWNLQMENYPDVESVETVQQLNKAIEQNENEIAASRRIFNANVSAYNQEIVGWPATVIAENRKLWTKGYLKASGNEANDAKVNLD